MSYVHLGFSEFFVFLLVWYSLVYADHLIRECIR